jgi:hypothetical protein
VILVILILVATALTVDVQAYIDPGTGSYVFQLAAAGLLTALYALKRHWRHLRDWARSLKHGSGSSTESGRGGSGGQLG